jgi:glucose-1-phosphate cytidylyltransferase
LKTVILCGGKGTRMGSVVENIPKPLIPIGDKPVLWHIMKIYATQGFKEFILCLGDKGEKIKEYFEKNPERNWKIEFVDTGLDVTKSERIKRIQHLIDEENFFLAYGDDVSNVDLNKLLKFHEYMDLIATITTVKLISQFGVLEMDSENIITKFKEKPVLDYWMNGGFMVFNKKIFSYLDEGELEEKVFEKLSKEKQICAYKHKGEWNTMNTLKDNIELNDIWKNGKAFWKIWRD